LEDLGRKEDGRRRGDALMQAEVRGKRREVRIKPQQQGGVGGSRRYRQKVVSGWVGLAWLALRRLVG